MNTRPGLVGINMNRDFKVKLLVGLSLVTVLFLALKYRTDYLILFISLLSGIIQIILFLIWYLEDSTILQKVDVNVETIKEIAVKRDEENTYRQKIIRKIINKGKIDECEIRKILAKLESRDMIIISLSECKIPKGLISNEDAQYPFRKLLISLGFVPVFFTYHPNIWIISKFDLPRALRNVDSLKNFILKELKSDWEVVKDFAIKNYPKRYDKWKSGEGFKASLIVGKSFEKDFKIDYLGRPSFNEEFIAKLLQQSSKEELSKVIANKVEVREILSKLSIELLLEKVTPNIKDIILKNEKKIVSTLRINSFMDYRNFDVAKLTEEFVKYLSPQDAQQVAQIVSEESNECYKEVENIGLLISDNS